MPKRHLEAPTAEARAKMRRQLGTLKSLTVQPITRKRYEEARESFYNWLRAERILLPNSAYQLDFGWVAGRSTPPERQAQNELETHENLGYP